MNTTASDSNKDLLELYDYTNEADNSELPGSEISSPEKKPKATRMCMVKKAIEVVVLGTVIVTVWILLSLPIVFFHIRSDVSSITSPSVCRSIPVNYYYPGIAV